MVALSADAVAGLLSTRSGRPGRRRDQGKNLSSNCQVRRCAVNAAAQSWPASDVTGRKLSQPAPLPLPLS